MMSDQDLELLVELEPNLLKSLLIGHTLLAELRAKHTITEEQREDIKVLNKTILDLSTSHPFLFKADNERFTILRVCCTKKSERAKTKLFCAPPPFPMLGYFSEILLLHNCLSSSKFLVLVTERKCQ